MTDTDFPLLADDGTDDLPRTLRREREARERAAREEEARKRAATLTYEPEIAGPRPLPAQDAAPAAVTRLELGFGHLMVFFIKAVFAAIPALILLGVLLWLAGALLKAFYPELVHTEVIIRVPR